MNDIAHYTAVIAFISLLGGCMLIRGTVGEPFAPEAVQFIQDGRTTKQEVVGRLGTPSVISSPGPGLDLWSQRRLCGPSLLGSMQLSLKQGV
jgi:hypothetical protein